MRAIALALAVFLLVAFKLSLDALGPLALVVVAGVVFVQCLQIIEAED